ncbi:unnamed protein product [Rotaria sp. Silwood2]|nr:unnamed protein product [Rotaria sp. Silwood2]CAF4308692.1 unnamed protein product [Rotaria sp. Silwood2]CAF4577393.1 unnamed protein product [Rotaria sp. Silwood2]
MTRLSRLHTVWADALGASNIGHGLWEELGSISYSMERLNEFDPELVIMHEGNIPQTALFRSYQQYIVPALTKTPLVEFGAYIRSFKTKYICFEKVFAGGQLSIFKQSTIKENHGREPLFYNWRSKIIAKNGFDPGFIPNKHQIIVTNKSNSQWTNPASNRHRAIANLKEVVNFIRKSYPTIDTEVVEWQNIPFNKQIEKLLNTTILITPCGGISMIIPMLPHGAHAIVMDYYATQEQYGFKRGQSASMEGAFLNHFPHVRKHYYQVYGSQDYEFDFPGAKDTRNDASVIVNTTRLQLLIDTALEDMQP